MTKKELARAIAQHMKTVRPEVDVERQATVLAKYMSKMELEKAHERHR